MADTVRLLIVSPHPVQHEGPALRRLAAEPGIALTVAYLSLPDATLYGHEEDITRATFADRPADGFPRVVVPNRSPWPGLRRFTGLWNPGLSRLICPEAADAVLVFGWAYASCWLAIVLARRRGLALLLSTDATTLTPQHGGGWKVPVKRHVLPWILDLADMVVVPSTAGRRFAASLDVRPDRVALTPYVVDNDAFAAAAAAADRRRVRAGWGVPQDAPVVLFVAKFIERKRPLDAVRAFSRAPGTAHLVMVGAGPLEPAIRDAAREAGLAGRVHLPGLVPYGRLAEAYAAADLVVLTSAHEPWGLTCNEAMACGRAVVASDRVGSAGDLIEPGVNGLTYPCGDTEALGAHLASLLADPVRLARMGAAAQARMRTWSPRDNAVAVAEAARAAVRRRGTRG